MLDQSLVALDSNLTKLYEQKFQRKSESLREQLLDSPTQLTEVYQRTDLTRLVIGTRLLKPKIGLAILHWYFPEEIRCLVHLWLWDNWGGESRELREILLTSKDFALSWLILQDRWNGNDFFGNIVRDTSKFWEGTKFALISRKRVRKYTGYCRGYQESNRRAPRLPMELFAESSVDRELSKVLILQNLISLWRERIEEFLVS